MIRRLFILLALAAVAMMFFGIASNYTERAELSGVATRYATQGPAELGAPNLVTAVVVTYRGLDTLGEVTVLFLSAAGVGLLLSRRERRPGPEKPEPPSEIVETATEFLLPIMVLFGIYIFLNGHLTPGGGFQGGAVIASAAMLMLLAMPKRSFSHTLLAAVESLSGFGYVVIGVLGVVLAGGFLDNRIIGLGEYGSLFSAGAIPMIYVLIGLKVGSELSALLERYARGGDGE
jgi:multicomponent Na+:H+ antiporter subunit B